VPIDLKKLLSQTFGPLSLPSAVNQSKITEASVKAALAAKPRRICFQTYHANALKEKRSDRWVGTFNVPFCESVCPLFTAMTGIELEKNRNYDGYWKSIRTEEEFDKVREWISEVGPMVFLRDTLAISIALSENQVQEGGRTEIGELEYQAKYRQSEDALKELTSLVIHSIESLPYYKDVTALTAVPPRPEKEYDVPKILARRVAKTLGKKDLTSRFSWKAKKPAMKGISVEEKWAALAKTGLEIDADLSETPRVLLLDDLYQSGITMQFVAMHLQQAGAKEIFGLSIVKARGDSDNV